VDGRESAGLDMKKSFGVFGWGWGGGLGGGGVFGVLFVLYGTQEGGSRRYPESHSLYEPRGKKGKLVWGKRKKRGLTRT